MTSSWPPGLALGRGLRGAAFAYVGIDDWRRHVRVDPELVRQTDPEDQRGNPGKARRELGWVPEFTFEQLVAAMVDADLLELSRSR